MKNSLDKGKLNAASHAAIELLLALASTPLLEHVFASWMLERGNDTSALVNTIAISMHDIVAVERVAQLLLIVLTDGGERAAVAVLGKSTSNASKNASVLVIALKACVLDVTHSEDFSC